MSASVSRPQDRGARWSALLGLLAENGRLSVAEVVEALGVSEATVRRDFTDLAAQQLVTRTHGGIVASAVAYDLPARYKQAGTDTAKDRIAAYAADLAVEGSVVGFNGGTTTSAVARRLAARADLASSSRRPAITVVTNALNIATEMVLRPFVRCVSLGGVARTESYELSGPLAAMVLGELWLDTVFLGVDAVSGSAGAMCHHEGEAGINALMVERAQRVVVVATGAKLGRRAFARICPPSRIDLVVTDSTAPEDAVADLRSAGVTVDVV
ncbi:DeoR/GlpR family DNA-binding transcription regulator [Phycicoccus sp. Soil748]|uniref:DeoR/GlpR family DNA-binding transcription regulator n=1 Tax=Intrasporangiaceae TaxID=85021 RepID=UPI00070342B0|nr:DeoR/GlpR family DNA-binding transcription regulator [Phycicoccus sp. Soil748]KRE55118.1 alkaline phosphatase [Phycicoccus sp. Soil748]